MSFNKAKALRQAEKHVQQGKINAAIDDYTKIAEFDPSDLVVVNTLGDLLVRAGRVEEAIINFSKIAENYRENGFTLKAIAMFKKISKLNPQDVDVSLKLAALYSQQGLLVEARQQYLQVADAHARSGKTQRALDVYQKIADLDPENTAVRLKLAETYLRENLREQAHDAYVAAGKELIRKSKVDDGLSACLKALEIDSESQEALTAVSEAYIHKGEPSRAIDLLKGAFDKNPGEVELINILGRTYLAAGMMDEAESTFTTLVQLDKSRYEHMLELGRTFANQGLLDRAAEQLDACVDILISRREEDRAIDFLHSLLDQNVNHVPSLTRLADIYQRIREDHNLINTLEALVEASVRAGQTAEAIDALKQLVRLEPENPSHRTRLQSLGVRTEDISSVPTGPFAARHKALDEADAAAVEREISDAARMARGGDITSAILILEQVIDQVPESIDAREHLRQLYAAQRMEDRETQQGVELARLYSLTGDHGKAQEMEQQYGSSASPTPAFDLEAPGLSRGESFEFGFGDNAGDSAPSNSNAFDLSGGFALPGEEPESSPFDFGIGAEPSGFPDTPAAEPAGEPMSESVLRDELEGVDFYIAQGYLEIARDTLDRLAGSFPGNSEIERRYAKLKSTADLKAQMEAIGAAVPEFEEEVEEPEAPSAEPEFDLSSMFSIEVTHDEPEPLEVQGEAPGAPSPYSTSELPPLSDVETTAEAVDSSIAEGETPTYEVGDIAGGFDLVMEPATEQGGVDVDTSAAAAEPAEVEEPESDLLDNLIDGLDDQFIAIESKPPSQPLEPQLTPATPQAEATANSGSASGASQVEQVESEPSEDSVLSDIFEEFKTSFEQDTSQDYDTHYNLGIAYRDMELLDDAIEEFQAAIRTTSPQAPDGRYIQCCNMLGLCFMAKDLPRLAVMWFKKGLDAPNRPEDEYQALRFDLGLAFERLGELDQAIDTFSEVYAIDINYRDVGTKLRELQERQSES